MTSRGRLLSAAVVLLAAGFSQAGGNDAKDPSQGLFSDDWMLLRLAGQPAGYAHETMSRDGDQITTRVLTVMSIARGPATVGITIMESTTETLAGAPLSFESVQKMADTTTTLRGRIHDGQVHITSSQFGLTTEQSYTFPSGAMMTWGLFAEQQRRGLKEGTSYALQTYVPSLRKDGAIDTKMTVGSRETIETSAGPKKCIRVAGVMSTPMGSIETISWLTDDGETHKAQTQMMGISLEMIRTDKETATKDIQAPEIFLDTLVEVGKRIDRRQVQRIRYRLRTKGEGESLPELPATGMQTPGKQTDGAQELTVSRQDHAALAQAGPTPPSETMAEFLENNIWINSDDPEVIAMAKAAAGDAEATYEIADRLRKYVTDVIDEKNLDVGFASASEVCRNKKGDCSEHGVLLAALGRVHKLPTRVVVGLVYVPRFGGKTNVFGFHMWTQFHIGGQWVDFDAAQRESDCNPTHIAMATSSLRDAALGDMAFALINVIGRLEIEIVEADPPSSVTDG